MIQSSFLQKRSFTRRLALTLSIAVSFIVLNFAGMIFLNYRFMRELSRVFELQQASRYLLSAFDEVNLAAETLAKAVESPELTEIQEQSFLEYRNHAFDSLRDFELILVKQPEFTNMLDPAREPLRNFTTRAAAAFASIKRGRPDAQTGDIAIMAQFKLELQESLTKVRLAVEKKMNAGFKSLYRQRSYPLIMGTSFTVTLIVVMSALGIALTRSFNRSMRNLLNATERLATGDLEARAAILTEDEFGRLSHAFNRMVNDLSDITVSRDMWEKQSLELRNSNQELEQFAFFTSHDLQEPLRKIQSFTELLSEYLGDSLDPKAKTYMTYVIEGTNRMRRLIQDLLVYSRAGSRELQKTKTDFDEITKRILDLLEEPIRSTGTEIDVGPMPSLDVTPILIEQVFQNLISNAIKFRAADRPLRISVSTTREGNEWVFSVKDNGIGIKEPYHDKIFDIFQRLHTQKEYQGSGVGLALCKKIVERHGGRIWVESRQGEGSDFKFTLPASDSS